MIFKVLALVVEQFWNVWVSYCKNTWSAKVTFFTSFC